MEASSRMEVDRTRANRARAEQRRVKRKVALFLVAVVLVLLGSLAYAAYWLFYDLERIPRGELLAEQQSPDGMYTVRIYVSDAGATTSFSVVGELIDNESGEKKTIYFQNKEHAALLTWLDRDVVLINGRALRVPDDVFDYRKNDWPEYLKKGEVYR
ncbi:DUF5412 family protein [Brevibacillus sp. TJ4]|uniref:DUF5412 family protein n=1 Tax=Brevibacillus sp. TJ4 TaxID=3234853 RepID=UPI0037D70AFD